MGTAVAGLPRKKEEDPHKRKENGRMKADQQRVGQKDNSGMGKQEEKVKGPKKNPDRLKGTLSY